MTNANPLGVDDVLAFEHRALRPNAAAKPLSALCISGGGIRSATFALGARQGLAERGVLEQFDYLSTVSGGGYIGSWLTAWVNRAGGLRHVIPYLRRDAPRPARHELDPIQHLREYNNYLSPKAGVFSFDGWALVATALSNVLLNWMVLIPLLMFALILPRLYLSLLAFPEWRYGVFIFTGAAPNYAASQLDAISTSPWIRYVLPLGSALLFATALFNTLRYLPGVGHEDHSGYDHLTKILAPLMGAVLSFLAFDSLYYLGASYAAQERLFTVALWTVIPSAAAWLVFLALGRGRGLHESRRVLMGLSSAIFAMAAGTGIATWVTANFLLWNPDPSRAPSWATYVTVGPPAILLGFGLGTVLFVGFSSGVLTDEDREWMSRSAGGVLLLCLAWTGACALVLMAPAWVLERDVWTKGALVVAVAATAWTIVSGGPPATAKKLAMPIFVALFVVGLALVTNVLLTGARWLAGSGLPASVIRVAAVKGELISWSDHNGVLTRASLPLLILFGAGLLAWSWLAARYINVNTFSLHGMYRDRLVRAYLGASNPARDASRFTGFARTDDVPMHQLDVRLKPFHVVNLTLNLVAADRLAWQQRKA